MSNGAETWFTRFRSCPTPRARLICLPFAGGSSSIYRRWHLFLPDWVDVCAVELPGRARRQQEPLCVDMAQVVDGLANAIKESSPVPYFLFGHSLGALIAFATAQALQRTGVTPARHLFVSGRIAPQSGNPDQAVGSMTDAELVTMLRNRGGTPPEVLNEPELMARCLPVIRADFRLLNSYRYEPSGALLVPLSIFGGTRDSRATEADLQAWRNHTDKDARVRMFAGDHFFISSAANEVVFVVAQTITAAITGVPVGRPHELFALRSL